MQMLEGTREALFGLLTKIKNDPRNCNLRIVIEGPARQRIFEDWGMELRDLSLYCDKPGTPEGIDFTPWQKRSINLYELGNDARTCYAFITGYAVRSMLRN